MGMVGMVVEAVDGNTLVFLHGGIELETDMIVNE